MHELKNGRYKYIAEHIGEGRTSQVFKGIDTTSNREVAIKRMRNREEARIESDIMKIVPKHPFLCEFIDCFEDQLYAYIVMAYMNGERLGFYKYGNIYPPNKAIEITLNILEGIEPFHKAGLLHCDLSPHNILLSKDQKTIQIIDFGCTVHKDMNGHFNGKPMIGTLGFYPPEQKMKGRSPLNDSTDLYSIACILLYLLNGKAPFFIEKACNQVKNPALQNVLRKATSYKKSDRYQSAHDLKMAISTLRKSM
ncbi:serine/threonine-protein kinase [Neobacillus niacini]|uniref:serine/threonine-protein kinase n=1 Tax=Neobacillus niacini TaxID=86668 RepID=UPI003B022EC8